MSRSFHQRFKSPPTPHHQMHRTQITRHWAGCIAVLMWLTAVALLTPTPALAVTCATGQPIDIQLPRGTRWEMCWNEDVNAGIELSSVFLTLPGSPRRRVLREASVGQIHEAFDNSAPAIHHVTQFGLGGTRLQTLNDADCRASERLSSNGRAVLCRRVVPRGIAFKYESVVAQGDLLELYSVSRTGRSTFVVRWQFFDSGSIVPSVGVTGQLAQYSGRATDGWRMNNRNVYAVGSTFNIFWRLNFFLGSSSADDTVEWLETRSSLTRLSKAVYSGQISVESVNTIATDQKRSWRVVDGSAKNSDATDDRGHAISVHLEPSTIGHRYVGPADEPWSRYDLFITRRNACERFATDNTRIERRCKNNVYEFINGGNQGQLAGADIVFWYKVTRHRLPSNEDEPVRPIEWNQFTIYPRDWTPENPLSDASPRLADHKEQMA